MASFDERMGAHECGFGEPTVERSLGPMARSERGSSSDDNESWSIRNAGALVWTTEGR